jgi:hypothetical protein
MPDVFAAQRLDILAHPWVIVEGRMQNVDNVQHVLAQRVSPLPTTPGVTSVSHDFH